MTHTATHTPGPLNKAIHAIPMLYAEAFAGSNNKEFVVELYKDAQLLETAAPAMYEALKNILALQLDCDGVTVKLTEYHCHQVREAQAALAQAEGKQ